MSKKLKIAVSCGGTGYHIFPGLAVASVLRDRGHHVTIWVAGKDVESEALSEWSGLIVRAQSEGLQYGFSLRSLLVIARMLNAAIKCVFLMRRYRPDVVIGMGSYSSFSPLVAAKFLRIPYVLHEANVIPGKANRLFSRGATKIAVAFEEARYHLQKRSIVSVGMPLRPELRLEADDFTPKKFTDEMTILVMGGSRGAKALNEMIPQALAKVKEAGYKIHVIHLAGVAEENNVRETYEKLKFPAKLSVLLTIWLHFINARILRFADLAHRAVLNWQQVRFAVAFNSVPICGERSSICKC